MSRMYLKSYNGEKVYVDIKTYDDGEIKGAFFELHDRNDKKVRGDFVDAHNLLLEYDELKVTREQEEN